MYWFIFGAFVANFSMQRCRIRTRDAFATCSTWYNLAPARCTSCYLRLVGLYLVLLQSLQNSLFNDAKLAYVRETTFFCLVSSLSRQDELRFNFRGQIWLIVPTLVGTALRALRALRALPLGP